MSSRPAGGCTCVAARGLLAVWVRILAVWIVTLPCLAQDWELGAAIGYGWYRNGSIYSPGGKAAAGIRNRFVAGAVLSEDLYSHLSGEVRYTYQDGDPFLTARGVKANVQGQSHTAHYDVLVHFRDRERRVRPYLAAGAGAKVFVVSGPPLETQPLAAIASLGTETDIRPVIVGGGGVKVRLARHASVRVDFRDYITPFPKKLIVPVPFGTARGILHQFTALAGVGYNF